MLIAACRTCIYIMSKHHLIYHVTLLGGQSDTEPYCIFLLCFDMNSSTILTILHHRSRVRTLSVGESHISVQISISSVTFL